jgi:predicted DNA-binding mobile mystery protein A
MARTSLDHRLTPVRMQSDALAPPRAGWIRTIREALGMTATQLARRMGVAQPTVTKLEQSEVAGRIQLDSLRRVAAALDCELVYALVPRRPLQEIVETRRRLVAGREYARAAHGLALEDGLDEELGVKALREAAMREGVGERELWNER